MILKYFAFLLISSLASSESVYFRKDYTYIERYQAFYKWHIDRKNFTGALTTCTLENAELFMPETVTETQEVVVKIARISNFILLAAHSLYADGFYVTMNGTSLKLAYNNWVDGQPRNTESRHCVTTLQSGYLYSDSCQAHNYFICKRSIKDLTQNPKCQTADMEYTYSKQFQKCYKLHSKALGWREAYAECISEDSSLVVINSQAEAAYLVRELDKYSEKFALNDRNRDFDGSQTHIGLSDLVFPGVFMTTEGKRIEDSGYNNWSRYRSTDENNRCGSMMKDGHLNTIPCDTKSLFVCEKTLARETQPETLRYTHPYTRSIEEN